MLIAICDDCQEDALRIKNFLNDHQVKIFPNGDELLKDMEHNNGKYDLYLLDIFMEHTLNGIEVAKVLRRKNQDAVICFISSSDDFYREAYDLYDVNYLLKPVKETAIRQLMGRMLRRQTQVQQKCFNFRWNGQMFTIPYGNILFITSSGHTLYIYCKDGRVQVCKAKLTEIEEMLDDKVFCRSHQSFLVNMYQVDNMSGTELMTSGHRIPISRRYYTDLKNRYQEILFEEVN